MENWDQDELERAIAEKESKGNLNRPTDIICKYFLDVRWISVESRIPSLWDIRSCCFADRPQGRRRRLYLRPAVFIASRGSELRSAGSLPGILHCGSSLPVSPPPPPTARCSPELPTPAPQAIEKKQYGWFWICPNGGAECKYRHALPPGYVLKSQIKALLAEEAANRKTVEEEIEEARAAIEGATPVTAAVFMQWKQRKARGHCVSLRAGTLRSCCGASSLLACGDGACRLWEFALLTGR